MRLLFAALLLAVGYFAYNVGYTRGLKDSPDYAAALAQRERLANDEELNRLQHIASSPPDYAECVPVIKGAKIDEYTFCEDLLSERAMRDQEAQQDSDRDRDRW